MIFLFFSSSLAHLEPELELFEVLEFGSWYHWRWWWFVARLSPIYVLFAFNILLLPVPTRPGTRAFLQVPDPSRPKVKNPYPSDPAGSVLPSKWLFIHPWHRVQEEDKKVRVFSAPAGGPFGLQEKVPSMWKTDITHLVKTHQRSSWRWAQTMSLLSQAVSVSWSTTPELCIKTKPK